MSPPDDRDTRAGGSVVPVDLDASHALDRTEAPTSADALAEDGELPPGVESGELLPGRIVAGRFKVISLLGKGGMGVVYRVHQLSVDRQAALKVLHPNLARDPLLVRRFEVEARSASRIIHPNGIVVYDFGREPDGLCFLAMEFVEGRSLRDVLKAEKRFPARRAIHVIDQMLAYLEELHGAGIVHRDLKPDNVFLLEGKGDRAKVIDFGLAKVADPAVADNLTRAGAIFGTPHYMSPEQGLGDPVDARSDLYACGIMLYELLVGKPPFTGGPATQIIGRHVVVPPPHPHTVNPQADLPPGLWDVLEKTLAKAPGDRPAGARALRELLGPFLHGTNPTILPEALGLAMPRMGGAALGSATLPPIAAGLAAGASVAATPAPAPTMPPVSKWPGQVVPTSPPPGEPVGRRADLPPRPDLQGYQFDDEDDAEPAVPGDDVIVEEELVEVLNGIFAALEVAVGPMADFVLRDSLGALGLGGVAPPDAMSHTRLAELVELASASVPAPRRDAFRASARRAWQR